MCYYFSGSFFSSVGSLIMNEYKQVILIRKDLNMSPGKMIAQGAHASLAAALDDSYQSLSGNLCLEMTTGLEEWLEGSQVKIVLGVSSEKELLDLYAKAQNANLPRSIIKDEGRTELRGQNYTAAAIGPADPEEINNITGHLRLL